MKFKVYFTQLTEGIEHCEAIVEAESTVAALAEFNKRNFTSYLCTKQEFDRVTGEDYVKDIEQVS